MNIIFSCYTVLTCLLDLQRLCCKLVTNHCIMKKKCSNIEATVLHVAESALIYSQSSLFCLLKNLSDNNQLYPLDFIRSQITMQTGKIQKVIQSDVSCKGTGSAGR